MLKKALFIILLATNIASKATNTISEDQLKELEKKIATIENRFKEFQESEAKYDEIKDNFQGITLFDAFKYIIIPTIIGMGLAAAACHLLYHKYKTKKPSKPSDKPVKQTLVDTHTLHC